MNMITDKNTSSSNYELSSKQGYDAKNHMEFFCFGSLVLEDWQAGIKHSLSDVCLADDKNSEAWLAAQQELGIPTTT